MNVLHIIDSLAIGGAERMAVNLCNVLSEQGHSVHLCASRAGGALESFISPDVGYLMLGRKGLLDVSAILRLATYIRKHRVAIVHAHSSSFFLATIVKAITRVRVVWHDHYGGSEDLSARPYLALRICSTSFSWIFAVNKDLTEWAVKKHLLPGGRISYLPNFPILARKSGAKASLPGRRDARIVCAARLNPQKDHHTLVRAMQAVNDVFPGATLLLVGNDPDDEYARSVKSLIAELGLTDRIHLLGARTDMAEILTECAIGVLSSKSEGLPVALLEYGMAGLPVVCTSVGECPAVLGHGAFGGVVSPGQPDALSMALIDLLGDPVKRRALADAFRAHVNDNYSGPAICRQVSDIYRKVSGDQ